MQNPKILIKEDDKIWQLSFMVIYTLNPEFPLT